MVRAWRSGSGSSLATQACSAMLRRRVTIGSQVACGTSHSTGHTHQRPNGAVTAIGHHHADEEAPAARRSASLRIGQQRLAGLAARRAASPGPTSAACSRSGRSGRGRSCGAATARVIGKGAESTRSGSSACWAYLWWPQVVGAVADQAAGGQVVADPVVDLQVRVQGAVGGVVHQDRQAQLARADDGDGRPSMISFMAQAVCSAVSARPPISARIKAGQVGVSIGWHLFRRGADLRGRRQTVRSISLCF